MSTINVTINDHTAEFTNMPIISSGSIKVDKIQFTFDNTWNNFTGRVCVFYKQRGQYWYGSINSSGVVNIPAGVMSIEGTITFGVSGYYNGTIKTTEVLSYNIYEGTCTDASDEDYETFKEIKNQMLAIQSQILAAADNVSDQIDNLSETLRADFVADFEELKSAIGDLTEHDLSMKTWKNNRYISSANGTILSGGNTQCVMDEFVDVFNNDILLCDESFLFQCAVYNSNNSAFITRLDFTDYLVFNEQFLRSIEAATNLTANSLSYPIKIKFGMKNVSGGAINYADVNKSISLFTYADTLYANREINKLQTVLNMYDLTSKTWLNNKYITDAGAIANNSKANRAVLQDLLIIDSPSIITAVNGYSFIAYIYNNDTEALIALSGSWVDELIINNEFLNSLGASFPIKIRISGRKCDNSDITGEIYKTKIFIEKNINYIEKQLSNYEKSSNYSRASVTLDPNDYESLSTNYITSVQNNYSSFMSEVAGDYNKIPLVIHTDQHSTLTISNPDIPKMWDKLIDWDDISKIINLGDTTAAQNFYPSQLKDYADAMAYVPYDKKIELAGNHDAHIGNTNGSPTDQYFKVINAKRSSKCGCFSVIDDYYNVKYVSINTMAYPSWQTNNGILTGNDIKFIIQELSDPERDIVILSHINIFKENLSDRYGRSYTSSDTFLSTSYQNSRNSFYQMIEDRQAKRTGSMTDRSGNTYAYNFTNCNGRILMALGGHIHAELYKTEHDLTAFFAQSFRYNYKYVSGSFAQDESEPNCFYFAYIDRVNKKFKCWKNHGGTTTYQPWEINLA